MQETWVQFLDGEDPLKKEMATHSSILFQKIPWTEEPGGLLSMGSHRVRHDWSDLAHIYICVYIYTYRASLVVQRLKHLPLMQETWVRFPGSGRSPGEGNGNPLQYSFLGKPTDRGAWQATVHGVAKESNTTERLNDNTRLGPSWCDWCSCELKAIPESSFSLFLCHEREEEDVTVCKPERELSLEPNHAGTLILDFSL